MRVLTVVRLLPVAGLPGHGRTLQLDLKRYRPLRAAPESLGNGDPPSGMELRPIDLLEPIEYVSDDPGKAGSP